MYVDYSNGEAKAKGVIDFSKARELVSYRSESLISKVRNPGSLPWCFRCLPSGSCSLGPTHLLFWQGKHLKNALCSEGMLSGISGQGSSAFLATEGFGDNRSPFVLSGAGWEQADV